MTIILCLAFWGKIVLATEISVDYEAISTQIARDVEENHIPGMAVCVVDKDGVIFITSQGERKTYWDNYQAIRAFKYTMAFIPKDRKGMYLLVPIENLQNVTSFLEENDINIEVIR